MALPSLPRSRALAAALALPLTLGLGVGAASGAAPPTAPPTESTTASARSQLRGGTVTVKRDTYGTPHVYADTTYGLFYGYGHSVAQDRLFQLDMTRRGAKGTVAEVLGADWVEFDTSIRTELDMPSIEKQYAALPERERDVLDGYAAGVNAWLDQVQAKRDTLLPKQYLDFGFEPARWTGLDVAMITVGTMNIRFSDYNGELDNLAVLQQLQVTHGLKRGLQIFNQIKYHVDPKAPATITPASGMTWPAPPRPPASANAPNALRMGETAKAAAAAEGAAKQERARLTGSRQFSNMMLVGRDRAQGANSILLNGPQFGWFNPSYVYGVGLHGAGYDLVGNTPFAYPVVLFGHNRDIAWGATAGNGDTVDMYQEVLNPKNPEQYLYGGVYRDMKSRTEQIKVKGGQDVAVQVRSTVHGNVTSTDPKRGVAYAKKRSWAGKELAVLSTWMEATRAPNWSTFEGVAERLPISINWYYTDRHGNIGYFAAGHFPQRPANQDPRLPASGTGNMEWRGIRPSKEANPRILNPDDGVLANWNNSPITNFPNSDFIPWGAADRVEVLHKLLAKQEKITPARLWEINKEASFRDINADYFLPVIAAATKGLAADSKAAQTAAALAAWDRTNNDEDRDGKYDSPGTAAMKTWIEKMQVLTLSDDLPPNVFTAYSTSGYPPTTPRAVGSQNIGQGTKLVHNALLGAKAGVPQTYDFFNGKNKHAVVREALEQTYDALAAAHGGGPQTWHAPVAPNWWMTTSYLQVPSASPDEQRTSPAYMNRGTENNLVVTHRSGLTQWDVVAPGQSGFIAPDGQKSRHYEDQLQMFDDFGHKRAWYTPEEVRRYSESSVTLRY